MWKSPRLASDRNEKIGGSGKRSSMNRSSMNRRSERKAAEKMTEKKEERKRVCSTTSERKIKTRGIDYVRIKGTD